MNTEKLVITKREDISPICPHCEQPIREVYVKSKGLGFIEGRNALYFCAHCHKVLGFGQSRMI